MDRYANASARLTDVESQARRYKLAMAAGRDAATRHMRKTGRAVWSVEDYNIAVATVDRLLGPVNPED